MNDLITNATREAADALNQRLEYVVLGAWRAGYDHVHIYDPEPASLAQSEPTETFAIQFYALEGYEGDPRPDPSGLRYRHTYDLTSAPDDEIRAALRAD